MDSLFALGCCDCTGLAGFETLLSLCVRSSSEVTHCSGSKNIFQSELIEPIVHRSWDLIVLQGSLFDVNQSSQDDDLCSLQFAPHYQDYVLYSDSNTGGKQFK